MASQAPSQRWWRPRFSLRTFLVLITLFSLWLGWRVSVVRRIERDINTIVRAGGDLDCFWSGSYKFTRGGVFWDPRDRRSYSALVVLGYRDRDLPSLLIFRETSNRPLAQQPSAVVLDDATMAEVAAALRNLSTVTRLHLGGSTVSGVGLSELAAVDSLISVDAEHTQLGDSDIDHIAKLTQLKGLDLEGTRFTAQGIAELSERLPNCSIHGAAPPSFPTELPPYESN